MDLGSVEAWKGNRFAGAFEFQYAGKRQRPLGSWYRLAAPQLLEGDQERHCFRITAIGSQ
jgi:hypothetical protein